MLREKQHKDSKVIHPPSLETSAGRDAAFVARDIKSSLSCTCLCYGGENWPTTSDAATADDISRQSEWKRRRKVCFDLGKGGKRVLNYCTSIQNHDRSSHMVDVKLKEDQIHRSRRRVIKDGSISFYSSQMKLLHINNTRQNVISRPTSISSLCLSFNKEQEMTIQKHKIAKIRRKLPSKRRNSIMKLIDIIPLVLILLLSLATSSTFCQQQQQQQQIAEDSSLNNRLHSLPTTNETQQVGDPQQQILGSSSGSSIELSPIRGPEYVSGEHDLLAQLLQSTGTLQEANQLLDTLIKAADQQQQQQPSLPSVVNEAMVGDYSQVSAGLKPPPVVAAAVDPVSEASSQVPIRVFMPAPLADASASLKLVQPVAATSGSLQEAAGDGQLKHRGLLDEIIEASAKGIKGENYNVHYDDEQTSAMGNSNPEALINAQRALELIRASKQIENFMMPPMPQQTTTRRPIPPPSGEGSNATTSNVETSASELKLVRPVISPGDITGGGDDDGLSNNESISSLMIRSATPSRKLIANYSHWIIHDPSTHPKQLISNLPPSKSKSSSSQQDAIHFISAPIFMTTTTTTTTTKAPQNHSYQSHPNQEANNASLPVDETKISHSRFNSATDHADHELVQVSPSSGGDEFLPVGSGHEPTRVRPASKFTAIGGVLPIWSNKFDEDSNKWQSSSLATSVRNETASLQPTHKIVYIHPRPDQDHDHTTGNSRQDSHSSSKHVNNEVIHHPEPPTSSVNNNQVESSANSSLTNKQSADTIKQTQVTIRPTTTTTSASLPVSVSLTTRSQDQQSNQDSLLTMTTPFQTTTESAPVRIIVGSKKQQRTNFNRKSNKTNRTQQQQLKSIKKSTSGSKKTIRIKSSGTTLRSLHQAVTPVFTTTTETMPTTITTTNTMDVETVPTSTENTEPFKPMTVGAKSLSPMNDQLPAITPLPVRFSMPSAKRRLRPAIMITTELPPPPTAIYFSGESVTEPATSTLDPQQLYNQPEIPLSPTTYYTTDVEQQTLAPIELPLTTTTTRRPEVKRRKKLKGTKKRQQVATNGSNANYINKSVSSPAETPKRKRVIMSGSALDFRRLLSSRASLIQQKVAEAAAVANEAPIRRSTMSNRLPPFQLEEETTDYSSAQLNLPAIDTGGGGGGGNTILEPVLQPSLHHQTTTPPLLASSHHQKKQHQRQTIIATTERQVAASESATNSDQLVGSDDTQSAFQRPEIESNRSSFSDGFNQSPTTTERSTANDQEVEQANDEHWLSEQQLGVGREMKVIQLNAAQKAHQYQQQQQQQVAKLHPINQLTNLLLRENHNRSQPAGTIKIVANSPASQPATSHFGKRLVEQQFEMDQAAGHQLLLPPPPPPFGSAGHHLDIGGQRQNQDSQPLSERVSPTPEMVTLDQNDSEAGGRAATEASSHEQRAAKLSFAAGKPTGKATRSSQQPTSGHKQARGVKQRTSQPTSGWQPSRSISAAADERDPRPAAQELPVKPSHRFTSSSSEAPQVFPSLKSFIEEEQQITTTTPSAQFTSASVVSTGVSSKKKPLKLLARQQTFAITKPTRSPEWSELATTSPYMLNVADGTTVAQAPSKAGWSEAAPAEVEQQVSSSPMPPRQFHEQLSALFRYKLANRAGSTTTTEATDEPLATTEASRSFSPVYPPVEYKMKGNRSAAAEASTSIDNATMRQTILRMFKLAADIESSKPSDELPAAAVAIDKQQEQQRRKINLGYHAGSYTSQPYSRASDAVRGQQITKDSAAALSQEEQQKTAATNGDNNNNAANDRRLRRVNGQKNDRPTIQQQQDKSEEEGENLSSETSPLNKSILNKSNMKANNSSADLATDLPASAFNRYQKDTTTTKKLHLNAEADNYEQLMSLLSTSTADRQWAADNGKSIDAYRKPSFNENLWLPENQQQQSQGRQPNNSIVKENNNNNNNKRNNSTNPIGLLVAATPPATTKVSAINQEENLSQHLTRAASHLNTPDLWPKRAATSGSNLATDFSSLNHHQQQQMLAATQSGSVGNETERLIITRDQGDFKARNPPKPLREEHEGETWIDGQAINSYRWTPSPSMASAGSDSDSGETISTTTPSSSTPTEKRKRRREPPVLPPIEKKQQQQQIDDPSQVISITAGSAKQAANEQDSNRSNHEQQQQQQLVEEASKSSMVSLGNLFARLPQGILNDYLPPSKDFQATLVPTETLPVQQQQPTKKRRESGVRSTATTPSSPISNADRYRSTEAKVMQRAKEDSIVDAMAVNASQNQRTSVSPLMDDFRTKSILKTLINLGVPKGGAIQSLGGLAGRNEQVRLVKIDKSRRHSGQQQQVVPTTTITTISNFTPTENHQTTDETLFTRNPVTTPETTMATSATETSTVTSTTAAMSMQSIQSTPAPIITTTCATTISPADAFSTRSTISRWHSGFGEPQQRPLYFEKASKLRRREQLAARKLATATSNKSTTNVEDNLQLKNSTTSTSSDSSQRSSSLAAPKDIVQVTSATPPAANSTSGSVARHQSDTPPLSNTAEPSRAVASSPVFGQKKPQVVTGMTITGDQLATSGLDLDFNRNIAPDQKQQKVVELTPTRQSSSGRVNPEVAATGASVEEILRPSASKSISTNTTSRQPPSVLVPDNRQQTNSEIQVSTEKPPSSLDYPDGAELAQSSTTGTRGNQLRNLRHSPPKSTNTTDTAGHDAAKTIEEFGQPSGSNRMGSVQRIAIMTISACCGLIVICLSVVAMSIKCQSSCDQEKYASGTGANDHRTPGGGRRRRDRRRAAAAAAAGQRGKSENSVLARVISHQQNKTLGLKPNKTRSKSSSGIKPLLANGGGVTRSQSRSNLLLLGSEISADVHNNQNSSTESTTSICMSTSSDGLNYMNVDRATAADYQQQHQQQQTTSCDQVGIKTTTHQQRGVNAGMPPFSPMGKRSEAGYLEREGTRRSGEATLRQRISGTLTSRLLRLHLPRLLPYFALDYNQQQQRSAESGNPYLINHQSSDATPAGQHRMDSSKNVASAMNVGELFGLKTSSENPTRPSQVRKDLRSDNRPKSLHDIQQMQTSVAGGGHTQNFHLRSTSSDKLLRQNNLPIKQQSQDDFLVGALAGGATRKQTAATPHKKSKIADNSKVCCHCQNCSSSWLFRDSVCLNQQAAGVANGSQQCVAGVVSRSKPLPFGAASSVLRSSPLVQPHHRQQSTASTTNNNSRLKLLSECQTDNSSTQHSQVDNEHHLLIDHETISSSSNKLHQQQQPTTNSSYLRQSQIDACYDRMRHLNTTTTTTNIVYDENEEEAASSINSHFGGEPLTMGHPSAAARQHNSDILGTRFSQRRDMSRESSNNEILNELHAGRHGGINEEDEEDDDDVEGDSENGNYYNLDHSYQHQHNTGTYQSEDGSGLQQQQQQQNESRQSLTSDAQQTSGHFKNSSVYKHHHHHHHQSRQQVVEKPQTNCNCNLVLYPL